MKKLDLEVLTALLHQMRGCLTSTRAKRAVDLLIREIAEIRNQPERMTVTLQETLELLLDVAEDAAGLAECDCAGGECTGTCTRALAVKAQVQAKEILVALYGEQGQAGKGER